MRVLCPTCPADLSKSGRCGTGASPLSLTERVINRFSQVPGWL